MINKHKVRALLAAYQVDGPESLDNFIQRSDLTEPERDYAFWYACAGANVIERGFIGICGSFDLLSAADKREALRHVFEEMDASLERRYGHIEMVVWFEFEKQNQQFTVA